MKPEGASVLPETPASELINIEVIHALPRRVWRVALRLASGSTVADAIELSKIEQTVPGLTIDRRQVGIFYRTVALDRILEEGDRVEIYRPLECDPKEVRRRRAAESG